MFYPTNWDWATLLGSIGLFLTLLFLFIRYVPMISISESRELIAQRKEGQVVTSEKLSITVALRRNRAVEYSRAAFRAHG